MFSSPPPSSIQTSPRPQANYVYMGQSNASRVIPRHPVGSNHNVHEETQEDIESQLDPANSIQSKISSLASFIVPLLLPNQQLINEFKLYENEDKYTVSNCALLLLFHILAFIYCYCELIFTSAALTAFELAIAIFWVVPLVFSSLLLHHCIKDAREVQPLDESICGPHGSTRSSIRNNQTYRNQYIALPPEKKVKVNRIDMHEVGLILSSSLCIGLHLLAKATRQYTPTVWTGSSSPATSLSSSAIYFVLLSPMFVSSCLRGLRWELSCLAQLLVLALSIASIATSMDPMLVPDIFFGLLFAVVPLYEARRRSLYRFLMIRDHQDLVSLQLKQLYDKENALKVADARTDGMKFSIANITHDLKTPLQSFQITLDELKTTVRSLHYHSPAKGSEEAFTSAQEMLNHLSNTCTIMFMTINRSLDFTKVSSGITLVPHYESINVEQTLAIPISCMRCLQTRIPIVVEPTPDICPMIITDRTWFYENILCLVSNAVKYSEDGIIRVSLKLVPSKQHTYLCVEVDDNGIGLSDEAKSKLFQPFNQAQRLAGGTGLGLFSLLQRMKALHGTCGVRNRSDGKCGSVFWFQFPYKPDEASATEMDSIMNSPTKRKSITPVAEDSAVSLIEKLRSLRILVVDDSLVILRIISKALGRAGHIVESGENGAIALRIIENATTPFDLVLTDLQMPVMDGYELSRRVREAERNSVSMRRQLIVGMSANNTEGTQSDTMAVEMDGFIPKPFNMNILVEFLLKYPSFRAHEYAVETGLLQDLGLFEYSDAFGASVPLGA